MCTTATGATQVVAIDETTGEVIGQAPTGQYPDGLAHDSRRTAIWTTNETAGTETVVDAATLQLRGTVGLGGEVGNGLVSFTSCSAGFEEAAIVDT